jgi:hypothetical protein
MKTLTSSKCFIYISIFLLLYFSWLAISSELILFSGITQFIGELFTLPSLFVLLFIWVYAIIQISK